MLEEKTRKSIRLEQQIIAPRYRIAGDTPKLDRGRGFFRAQLEKHAFLRGATIACLCTNIELCMLMY